MFKTYLFDKICFFILTPVPSAINTLCNIIPLRKEVKMKNDERRRRQKYIQQSIECWWWTVNSRATAQSKRSVAKAIYTQKLYKVGPYHNFLLTFFNVNVHVERSVTYSCFFSVFFSCSLVLQVHGCWNWRVIGILNLNCGNIN